MSDESESDGTTVSTNGTRAKVTEKALDHAVDGICAVGIVTCAYAGAADMAVVGGLVSIALGKRVLNRP